MGVRKLPSSHWAVRAEGLFRLSVKEDIEAHKKAGRYGKIGRLAKTGRFAPVDSPAKNVKNFKKVRKPSKRT